MFDATTKTTAILTDGGTRLLLRTEGTEPREITLDGTAAQITLASEGRVLAPMDGRVQIVDIASGEAASTAVDGEARSAAFLPDGRLAVGLSNGRIQVITGTGGTKDCSVRYRRRWGQGSETGISGYREAVGS